MLRICQPTLLIFILNSIHCGPLSWHSINASHLLTSLPTINSYTFNADHSTKVDTVAFCFFLLVALFLIVYITMVDSLCQYRRKNKTQPFCLSSVLSQFLFSKEVNEPCCSKACPSCQQKNSFETCCYYHWTDIHWLYWSLRTHLPRLFILCYYLIHICLSCQFLPLWLNCHQANQQFHVSLT